MEDANRVVRVSKDKHNEIAVNFVLEGDVNNPQFSRELPGRLQPALAHVRLQVADRIARVASERLPRSPCGAAERPLTACAPA